MIERINIQDPSVAQGVVELQRDSYQVEATLLGVPSIPPMHDTVESLTNSCEIFLGYLEDGHLCGILAYQAEGAEVDICRVAVHPEHFRKGIARALLAYLEATELSTRRFVVQTGAANTPAVTLYEKAGFQFVGEEEVEPHLFLKKFEKIRLL